MKRTALYIRCSSLDQLQRGFSIPDQLARLRAEARQAGETVVGEFIDQARSGTNAAKRREYQKLLAAARRREFERVRVESVDRGHRNDTERRQFEDELRALEIKVSYSGEPEQQAPQYRKFNRAMRGVVAELESDEASQRTYKRHLYRAKKGKWRGGVIPYGIEPDGDGWFKPDPETYAALCWILERRAEGLGYYRIARLINTGIPMPDGTRVVPPTPNLRIYLRKPYLERQDPETGEVLHVERARPDPKWKDHAVRGICKAAVDGVYAGILQWGREHNRFDEDADGKPKEPVEIDTGRPLVDVELLRRVQAVELDVQAGVSAPAPQNRFLLARLLHCGHCDRTMPGYTTSKYKGERRYKYRKYRCNGRLKRPGSCTMPTLSAETLERTVMEAVFDRTAEHAPQAMIGAVNAAVERRRGELARALETLDRKRGELEQQRNELLDSLVRDRMLKPVLRDAIAERAEEIVTELAAVKSQQETLRVGLETLDTQARTVSRILSQADVDPERWQEAAVNVALQRALRLLVRRIEVTRQGPRNYTIRIWLPDAENLLFSQFMETESTCTISFTKTTIPRRYVPWQEVAA
jgi:DNA invertase Pin-like site-specific DNA recombinase